MDVRDDYVRPEAPQPSPLWRTAEALKEISGPLASMFDGFQKGNDAAQKNKAEADFWQGNSAGAGEAVRSGAIPAFASPIYTKTTQDLQSASYGIKLDGQIGQAYQESDIKTSQDPQAYDKWFAGTVKKLTDGQPNFMFGKANIEGIHSKYAQKWLADRNQATVNNQLAAGTALAGSTIDEFRNNAVANGGTVDVKNLGDAMTTLRTKLYDAGMEKSQVDKVITDTITSKATDYAYDNDGAVSAQILSTLDNTAEAPSGKAGALVGKQAIPLAQTPYGMIQKQATTAAVQRLIHQRDEQAFTKLTRENKADHDEGLRAITQSLAKDPNANIPEPVIAKVERYDPDFRKNLIQLRNTFLDAGVKEDPEKVASVYRDIVNGGGLATVRKALAPDGAIKKPATMSAAMTFAESVDKNLSSDAPVTRMSTYSKTIEQIEARTKTSGPGALFDTKGITDAGRAAENDFKVAAMKWATTVPPETPPEERERQLQAIAETYINQVGENTYTAPAGAPQGNPTQVKPPEAPTAAPTKSKSDLADEAEAQRLRIPVQQYKQMLQDRVNKLRQGSAPAEAPPAAVTPAAPSGAAPTAPPLGKRSDINIPGLGSMSFAGLDDEQMGHIKTTLASLPGLNFTPEVLNRPDVGPTPPSASITGSADQMVSQRRVQSIDATPVGPVADKVAQETGFDPAKLKAIVSIESSGNPNSGANSSYKGLGQLNAAEWRKYGDPSKSILDPEANLRATVASLKDKEAKFTREFGHAPSATELYLMHQQGEAGLRAHLKNPDAPAWENMANTGEGKQKGDAWAQRAIWGNVPGDLKKLFGSVDNMSSREFLAVWMSKVQGVPYSQALASLRKSTTA